MLGRKRGRVEKLMMKGKIISIDATGRFLNNI